MDETDPEVEKAVNVIRATETARVGSLLLTVIGMTITFPTSLWIAGFKGLLLFVGISLMCFGVSMSSVTTFAKLLIDEIGIDENPPAPPVATPPTPGASEGFR